MEEGGDLQALMAHFGVYRRADVQEFVTWARSTIERLRDVAEDAIRRVTVAEGRAVDAEARAAAAEARANAAEARSAQAEDEKTLAERALARRDRDMHAVLGKALLLVQETADAAVARASGQQREHEFRFEPAPPPELWDQDVERVRGIWASNEDDSLLAPLRAARASGK